MSNFLDELKRINSSRKKNDLEGIIENTSIPPQDIIEGDINDIPTLRPSDFLKDLPKTRFVSAPTENTPLAQAKLSSTPKFEQPLESQPEEVEQAEAAKKGVYGAGLEAEDLLKARANAASGKGWAQILSGLSKVGSGLMTSGTGKAPAQVDTAGFEKAGALGEEGVTTIKEGRAAKKDDLNYQKALQEINDEASMRDPNSTISKAMRDGMRLAFPNIKIDESTTGKQLRDSGVNLGSLLAAKMEADARRIQLAQSREDRLTAREFEQEKQVLARIDRQLPDYVEKVAAPASHLQSQYDDLERTLGVKLDNVQFKNGKALDSSTGKQINIPGVRVFGVADSNTLNSMSPEARLMYAAVANIFNEELKRRSGTAVTEAELANLKREFAMGKFNSEAEVLRRLKEYRDKAHKGLVQREKGYMPRAVQMYKEERGGITASDIFKAPSTQSNSFTPDVMEYANKHGITPEQAQAIKNKRLGR